MNRIVIFIGLILSFGCKPGLTLSEKFIKDNITHGCKDEKQLIIFIYPQFCGACSEESMSILKEITEVSTQPIMLVNAGNIPTTEFNVPTLLMDANTLAKHGLSSTTNQLIMVEQCKMVQRISITAENKKTLLEIVRPA